MKWVALAAGAAILAFAVGALALGKNDGARTIEPVAAALPAPTLPATSTAALLRPTPAPTPPSSRSAQRKPVDSCTNADDRDPTGEDESSRRNGDNCDGGDENENESSENESGGDDRSDEGGEPDENDNGD